MATKEELKVRSSTSQQFMPLKVAGDVANLNICFYLQLHRHHLYCSVADACQHGSVNGSATSTAALLSQLQAVLEAESCLSCMEEDCDAGKSLTTTISFASCWSSCTDVTCTSDFAKSPNACLDTF